MSTYDRSLVLVLVVWFYRHDDGGNDVRKRPRYVFVVFLGAEPNQADRDGFWFRPFVVGHGNIGLDVVLRAGRKKDIVSPHHRQLLVIVVNTQR